MEDNVFKALQLLENEGYDTSLLKGSKEQIEEINDINESAIKNAIRFLNRHGFDVSPKII